MYENALQTEISDTYVKYVDKICCNCFKIDQKIRYDKI